jgi:predicted nucleic acid-binding protein
MSALLDTGVLYALVDRSDKWHDASVRCLSDYRDDVLIPAPVITEACFLIDRAGGAPAISRFLQLLVSSAWQVCALLEQDYTQASSVLDQYADSRIDFVDAAVIAIAERLRIRTIFTLDRRDFGMYRPTHCDYFELLP